MDHLPDPQLKSRRAKKRLTSPLFLEYYAQLLQPDGWINLKTDSQHLYGYTNEVIRHFGLPCEVSNPDIYGSGYADEVLSVKTAYEQQFLRMGLPISLQMFLESSAFVGTGIMMGWPVSRRPGHGSDRRSSSWRRSGRCCPAGGFRPRGRRAGRPPRS